MHDSTSIFLTMIMWVITGIATAYVASKRGRDPFAWFAIGIFLGLLGFLILLLLPKLNEEDPDANPQTIIINPEKISPPEIDYPTKEWYCIDREKQQQGPVDFNYLKTLWDDNRIDLMTFVWCEGMGDWKKIEDLPKLHQLLKEVKQDPPQRDLDEL